MGDVEMGETKPCDYCGTTLSEDESLCVASGERHYVSTCREYVHAALRATKADLAAANEAKEKAERDRHEALDCADSAERRFLKYRDWLRETETENALVAKQSAENRARAERAEADLAQLRQAAARVAHEHACGGPDFDAEMQALGRLTIGVVVEPKDCAALAQVDSTKTGG